MAKDPSKTEKPTPKRIRDAREEGKVIASQDVSALISVLGGAVLLLYLAPQVRVEVENVFRLLTAVDCGETWSRADVRAGIQGALGILAPLLLPLLATSVVLALAGRVAQVGPYFETKPLLWRLSSMNPASGVKQILPTGENLTKLLLVLGKVGLIGLLAYTYIRRDLPAIAQLPLLPLREGAGWSLRTSLTLLLKILGTLLAVAATDYCLKRRKYFSELMMSRQEIRDETKNTEGDPHIRGRRRQRMRELTRMRLIAEVPKADVVIVNPTHVAVALRYSHGWWAPRIVAKGLRKRAARIRETAAKAGVPIVREPPTARALYRYGTVGQYIPDHLFGAVAVILARLEKIGARKFNEPAEAAPHEKGPNRA